MAQKHREFMKLLEYNKGTGLTYATLCLLEGWGYKLTPLRENSPQYKRAQKDDPRESNL